ncbi:type III pantothenate kinase [Fibrella aestuarina BUZ 2]|uniref:Type III pantothenate kinase n=1 Tax=Fibrella aestuarina BUZ 2 TaxID=1166018 RepID=I0KCP6_9BACT|nr:type III pantothenate kinase [Fibrella aestuarina]CCH01899.1 type III pantothenate kinase [Fibrella aestuarina BUZ 2]
MTTKLDPAVNLAIDWGNTRIKAGWFAGNQLQKTARYASPDDLRDALQRQPPQHVIVSSTSRPADELRLALDDFDGGADWLLLSPTLPVPVKNGYETPQTLGADRLAAAAGVAAVCPGEPCLVLDLGTCITADFVSAGEASGTFEGGLIAPGLQMRLRAMHTFTARLPLPELPALGEWPPITARNTRDALLSGAMNGMALELNGLIDRYTNQYPHLRVIVCGGDAPLFVNRLKPGIFAVPDLVLLGLNQILLYNLSRQNH